MSWKTRQRELVPGMAQRDGLATSRADAAGTDVKAFERDHPRVLVESEEGFKNNSKQRKFEQQ